MDPEVIHMIFPQEPEPAIPRAVDYVGLLRYYNNNAQEILRLYDDLRNHIAFREPHHPNFEVKPARIKVAEKIEPTDVMGFPTERNLNQKEINLLNWITPHEQQNYKKWLLANKKRFSETSVMEYVYHIVDEYNKEEDDE